MTTTPAGWYPDPQDPSQVRYWDGQAWSETTAPAGPVAPSEPAAPAAPSDTSPYGAPSDPAAGQGYGAGYPSYPSYSSFPAGQPGMPNPYAEQKPSNTLSIIGIVCGAIGFLICPIVLGIAGLVLGFVARSKKEPLANVALIVSGIGLVGGLVLGLVVYNTVGV
ncbi:MAG: DUF2510 domain-containing protein [Marmoricola sp.]